MRYAPSSLLALLLSGASLAALSTPVQAADICSTPDGFSLQAADNKESEKGFGGTGVKLAEKGFGGTGISGKGEGGTGITGKGSGGTGVRFAGKGTGGTGITLGNRLGIYGRITGFGSICVNGLEVHYSPSTPVEIDGARSSTDQLQEGQVVAVVAALQEDRLVAHDIAVDHLLTGKIDAIHTRSDTIEVDGHRVAVSDAAAIDKMFNPGDYINISGFKDAHGDIVASHVEKCDGPEDAARNPAHFTRVDQVAVQGLVTAVESRGETASVILSGETRIDGLDASRISINDRVIIFADVEGGQLKAEHVEHESESIRTGVAAAEDHSHSGKSTREDDGHRGRGGRGDDEDDDHRGRGGRDEDEKDDDDNHSGHGSDDDDDNSGDDDSSGHGGDDDDNSGGGGDDDNSGPGGGDDDLPDSDDNSGPGGGDDDLPDSDDNSGPGGGDDIDAPDIDEPEVDEPDIDEPDIDEPDVDEPDIDDDHSGHGGGGDD